MEIAVTNSQSRESIESLVSEIQFFKRVREQSESQFNQLLAAAQVGVFAPGEVVLRKGGQDPRIFFLIKGRLAVYIDHSDTAEFVNHIACGEVFGDIAQLLKLSRSATLLADGSATESIVLALDSSLFEPLDDFTELSLATKLAYYRNMVQNFRWKLEVYRAQNLQSPLANKHREIPNAAGATDTSTELFALHQQAKQLALLLMQWNQEFAAH